MEIIKNGKEKTFYARCGNCASELNYTLDEVKTEESVLRGKTKYIVCPVCNSPFAVNLLTEEEVKEQAKRQTAFGYTCCAG